MSFASSLRSSFAPVADPMIPTTIPTVSQTRRRWNRDIALTALPMITRPIRSIAMELLPRLQLCQRLCDFTDLDSDLESKEIKSTILRDLDIVFNDKPILMNWPPELFQAFFRMILVNLFRELPPLPPALIAGAECPVFTGIAWSHLHLCIRSC
jgi:hypothetical protein